MKTTILSVLVGLIFGCPLFGQNQQDYTARVREAEELYNAKEYLLSAKKYAEAFTIRGAKERPDDRYNAACSWALARETDSAFAQLFQIAKSGDYTNYTHLVADTDLQALHTDARWNELLAIVQANKEKADAHLDKTLVAVLDTIYQDDQKHRLQLDAAEEQHGWNSKEVQTLWRSIHDKDSVNVLKVQHILDTRGWLGADSIGVQGNATLFLVIQHAELAVQEQYLPMMRDAVRKGNAQASSLALLEDRVALRKGGKQIYGSQIGRDEETGQHFVFPLLDPENVDTRRAEVGLAPLQDYIARWGITWNVEEYKKQLPALEAKQKK